MLMVQQYSNHEKNIRELNKRLWGINIASKDAHDLYIKHKKGVELYNSSFCELVSEDNAKLDCAFDELYKAYRSVARAINLGNKDTDYVGQILRQLIDSSESRMIFVELSWTSFTDSAIDILCNLRDGINVKTHKDMLYLKIISITINELEERRNTLKKALTINIINKLIKVCDSIYVNSLCENNIIDEDFYNLETYSSYLKDIYDSLTFNRMCRDRNIDTPYNNRIELESLEFAKDTRDEILEVYLNGQGSVPLIYSGYCRFIILVDCAYDCAKAAIEGDEIKLDILMDLIVILRNSTDRLESSKA